MNEKKEGLSLEADGPFCRRIYKKDILFDF